LPEHFSENSQGLLRDVFLERRSLPEKGCRYLLPDCSFCSLFRMRFPGKTLFPVKKSAGTFCPEERTGKIGQNVISCQKLPMTIMQSRRN
jgi:hypothetical protein